MDTTHTGTGPDTRMDNQLSLVLSPGYVEDLATLPMEDVRTRRTICQQLEAGHSLLRRMIQGRLDIVGSELSRRRDGGDAAAEDVLSRLPEILAEHRPAHSAARPPSSIEPEVVHRELVESLEDIVSSEELVALGEIEADRLNAAAEQLTSLETRISGERRALHERIDVIQAEVMRRYRTGEETVDSLLS